MLKQEKGTHMKRKNLRKWNGHIQKQVYVCQLMNELDSLEDNIKKEQILCDSTNAKRKQMENETDRLNKSKLRTFYFRCTLSRWSSITNLK